MSKQNQLKQIYGILRILMFAPSFPYSSESPTSLTLDLGLRSLSHDSCLLLCVLSFAFQCYFGPYTVQGNHPKFRSLRCGVKITLSLPGTTDTAFLKFLVDGRSIGLILANKIGAEVLITYVGFFSLSHFFHHFFLATFQIVQL